MAITQYKIRYAYSARDDVAGIKRYILSHFKYCQLVENFKKKMQKDRERAYNLSRRISPNRVYVSWIYDFYETGKYISCFLCCG